MIGRRYSVLLGALFFVSGLTSLIFETIWTRMMVHLFGSTSFAVSTVLATFMGGLALGSWIAGVKAPRLRRRRDAILTYGLLELGIGLYALALPSAIAWLAQASWLAPGDSYYQFALARFVCAAALLLLPTVAMGATLPLLAHAIDPGRSRVGRDIGLLYAVNTAGAVLGVWAAGFWLMPKLGLRAAQYTAVAADVGLAAIAALLWWRMGAGTTADETSAPPTKVPLGAGALLALVAVGLSGAIAMGYEVAWTRALSLVLGSSTYSFSLILLCYLLGLSVGAALYARRQAADPDQFANISTIQALAAATALLGLAFIDDLPAMLLVGSKLFDLRPSTVFVLKFALAGSVVILPAMFLGMMFPAVVSVVGRTGAAPSKVTAAVYGANTLGAIVGSFAAGFVLIPTVGVQITIRLLVVLSVALATVFAWRASSQRWRRRLALAVAIAPALLIPMIRPWDLGLMTSGAFRFSSLTREPVASLPPDFALAQERALIQHARSLVPVAGIRETGYEPTLGSLLVEHREGITTTVDVTRGVFSSMSDKACWVQQALMVNGKPDASLTSLHAMPSGGCRALLRRLEKPIRFAPSGDSETQILSGLLALTLHPQPTNVREALVIGWGSGFTAGALTEAGVQVAAVELEPEVIAAARVFEPFNHAPQLSPKLRLLEADGRNVIVSTRKRYDLIVSEPSNPWIAGCGNLFTVEFFKRVHDVLRDDGVFLQWLQAYEISPLNVRSILATLSQAFDHLYLFNPAHAPADLLIVARKSGQPLDWKTIDALIRQHQKQFAPLQILGAEDIAIRLAAEPDHIRRLSKGAPVNTDDNARLEFEAPKDLINFRRHSPTTILKRLRSRRAALKSFTKAPKDAKRLMCRAALRGDKLSLAREHGEGRCAETVRAIGKRLAPIFKATIASAMIGVPKDRHAAWQSLAGDQVDLEKVSRLIRDLKPKQLLPNEWALLAHAYALARLPYEGLQFAEAAAASGAGYPGLLALRVYLWREVGLASRSAKLIASYPQAGDNSSESRPAQPRGYVGDYPTSSPIPGSNP